MNMVMGIRDWLCIAYAFPPINRSGTHRTAAFVYHLERLGWRSTVLTVGPSDEAIDEQMLEHVPQETTILRTPWCDLVEVAKGFRWRRCSSIKRPPAVGSGADERSVKRHRLEEWFSQFLKTPDSRLGWVPFAMRAGIGAIRNHRPDILYSTSPYASAHLIAWCLHQLYRIPWVADFRDPWMENPYQTETYPWIRRWSTFLERRVLGSASVVVCNTPTAARLMRQRYPRLANKFRTIMNGIDSETVGAPRPTPCASVDTFVLMHAGQFYGPRRPHMLFDALRLARRRLEGKGRRVELVLLGDERYDGLSLSQIAADAGLSDGVRILGSRSHAETQLHLRGADALVLIGSSGRGADLQVPNKLFEYLGAQKPILAAVPMDSPVIEILRTARADALVCDPTDTDALAATMVSLEQGTYARPTDAWSGVWQWDRSRRALELMDTFESLLGSRTRRDRGRKPEASPIKISAAEKDWSAVHGRSSSPDRVPTAPA